MLKRSTKEIMMLNYFDDDVMKNHKNLFIGFDRIIMKIIVVILLKHGSKVNVKIINMLIIKMMMSQSKEQKNVQELIGLKRDMWI